MKKEERGGSANESRSRVCRKELLKGEVGVEPQGGCVCVCCVLWALSRNAGRAVRVCDAAVMDCMRSVCVCVGCAV